MKDNNAWTLACHLEHARVITVIVSHVIDDRIVVAECFQN